MAVVQQNMFPSILSQLGFQGNDSTMYHRTGNDHKHAEEKMMILQALAFPVHLVFFEYIKDI